MKLPYENAGYAVVVKFARYTARRLRRSGHAGLATDLDTAAHTLRAKGRAWDDTEDGVQDALADRDAADDGLDTATQEGRALLAGRSVSAAKEEPYSLIFGEGIAYYTAATLDDELSRYGELLRRVQAHLPEGDAVRTRLQSAIPEGLTAFSAAVSALDAAGTTQSLARTELERADRALRRQLEKTYGVLVSEVGKPKAERYFPKTARQKNEVT